jgi:O-antigen/teichoic acid export membrane protein
MKSQLKAGALLSYIALFISSAISIVYTPIMLKFLGQSEYGLYSLATSASGYIGVLNFGLGNAVIRYTAKYKALKDEEECSRLYGMFFIMYSILGALALVSGIILTLNSENIFSNSLSATELNKLTILMIIMVINISIGIGLGLFSVIVLAHEKFIIQKVITIAGTIINPIIMVPLLFMGYESVSLVIVTTIISFITILINIYYCIRVLKIKMVFKKVQKDLLKEIVIFSSYIFLNLVIDKIYWSTDQIILGIYSGTVAISIYTIGASFTGYFSGLSSAISNVFLSKVTGMVTKEASDKEISDLFIRVGRIQYIILSFALSGFIVFGREFIDLWVGKEYSDSYIIAVIILIPSIVSLTQGMGGIILQAKNMQRFKSVVYFLIAIGNVFLTILFVQWWGAIGSAVATAAAFTIGNIVVMNVYYWKKLKIEILKFWKNILYMSFPLVMSLAFGLTINNIMIADSWIILFIKMVVFSILYTLLMWLIGMNSYEKDLILSPLKHITSRFKKEKLYKVS